MAAKSPQEPAEKHDSVAVLLNTCRSLLSNAVGKDLQYKSISHLKNAWMDSGLKTGI